MLPFVFSEAWGLYAVFILKDQALHPVDIEEEPVAGFFVFLIS